MRLALMIPTVLAVAACGNKTNSTHDTHTPTLTGVATGVPAGTTTGMATGATTGAATGASTGTATGASTGTSTGTATGASTGTGTGASTGTATGASTGTATGTGTSTGTTTGTATGTSTTPVADIEIIGTWSDPFGSQHIISNTLWTMSFPGFPNSDFHITQYDNAADWAVARNDLANPFNPGLWSRFDWYIEPVGGQVYFCQTAFNEATEADALAVPPADSTNLYTGCGGLTWSALYP